MPASRRPYQTLKAEELVERYGITRQAINGRKKATLRRLEQEAA